MKIDVPLADVVDKITILRIKIDRIADLDQVSHARRELAVLLDAWWSAGQPDFEHLPATAALAEVNAALWDVEDALRDHERRQDFGAGFVELARSVYRLNDRRAALKADINEHLGSALVEVKSYTDY